MGRCVDGVYGSADEQYRPTLILLSLRAHTKLMLFSLFSRHYSPRLPTNTAVILGDMFS